MTLLARRPGFGWEEVLGLLVRGGAEGTISACDEATGACVDILFLDNMVLLPIAASRGSRQVDQREANARLREALGWSQVSFRFKPGFIAPGTVAHRSLVLEPPRLLQLARQRSAPAGGDRDTPAVWGELPGAWLTALLRGLGLHRRSGRLVIETEDGAKLRLVLRAGEVGCAEAGVTAATEERELRRTLLTAGSSPRLRFAFVARGPGTPSDGLPPGTGRLLKLVARQGEVWRRVNKLLAARHTAYRLTSPAAAGAARELTGLPRLVAALDGSRSFVELLADTELPPLIAAHGLARLMVERHAVACRRPGAPSDASSLALGSGDLRELAASPSSSCSGLVPARATVATAVAATAPPVAAPRLPATLESEVLTCAATSEDPWPAARPLQDSRRWSPMEVERKKRSTAIQVRRPATARLRRMRAG